MSHADESIITCNVLASRFLINMNVLIKICILHSFLSVGARNRIELRETAE